VVTHAHAELAQLAGGAAVASFPLTHNGRAVGALTLERAHGARFDAQTLELVEGLAGMLGPLLELQRTRHQSLPPTRADGARPALAPVRSAPRRLKLGAVALVAAGDFPGFRQGRLPGRRRRAHRRARSSARSPRRSRATCAKRWRAPAMR
jgi:hypothetical protein